jgi:hypothetical protein
MVSKSISVALAALILALTPAAWAAPTDDARELLRQNRDAEAFA